MNTSVLLNFLDSLERQGMLPVVANKKIQNFLDYSTRSTGKLFLVFAALIGAMFVSAGIFAIISHNWDDFPKHVRGVLSFVPALAALYVYYVAVFKHSTSTSWIEAASLFLMLMIGASIALVSQTYQMDGDFDGFAFIWLLLTIPLFYIARASGIAIFYLGLACWFLYPDINIFGGSLVESNEKVYFFWLFFFAYVPHFYLSLNTKSSQQGIRAIYLGWITAIFFVAGITLTISAGYLWWGTAALIGFYLLGKKFYADNLSSLGRPFQTLTLAGLFIFLTYLSDRFLYRMMYRLDGFRDMGNWEAEQFFYYFVGLTLVIVLTVVALDLKKKEMPLNRYVIFTPFMVLFLYIIYCFEEYLNFDITWIGMLVLNFYILGFGINAMIQGNKSKNVVYMFYGLYMITNLLWLRYMDMDWPFWLKGLFFIGVGFMFFMIHYLSKDEFEEEQP
jgi:uncharacterized membrane protein